MKPKRIQFVFGTRPEIIKLASFTTVLNKSTINYSYRDDFISQKLVA
ncbi:MAG TPA: hypothetical protein PKH65_10170 [Bacteroidia bacterium]|nr:hypothetical protein [Bacteroidia bacterium]